MYSNCFSQNFINPVADATVIGGENAGKNYGADTILQVKKAAISANNYREFYIKFDLSQFGNNIASISLAQLKLTINQAGDSMKASNSKLKLYYVANDSWTEGTGTSATPHDTGITFSNNPGLGTLIDSINGEDVNWVRGSQISWDITDRVRTENGGDKILTFRIESTYQHTTANASFFSKTAPSVGYPASYMPRIEYAVLLPLKLTEFTGRYANHQVYLNWATTHEKNLNRFEIEYSTDGKTFAKAGQQLAANAAKVNNYSYIHSPSQKGMAYYRLKIIENNGTVSYSNILRIHLGNEKQALSVYPNPATDKLVVNAPVNSKTTLQILNVAGALMQLQTLSSAAKTIDISSLKPGLYMARLGQANETMEPVKFMKQ